jgi:hypothetical protein
MMLNASLAIAYAILTALVALSFRQYPDHSLYAVLHWSALYVAGVMLPVLWTFRTWRQLERVDAAARDKLRPIMAYPIIAGVVVLLVALNLIRQAALLR